MSHVHEDLDTLLQNDSGRKLFALFLKEFNNSSDNLLTLYLICSCFQNQRIDDRHRIKQILEKTYQACFVKNQLPYLNPELKQKLCDSLKKNTYNESIFNAVKKELKNILENEYFPLFLNSKIYLENMTNKNHTEQKSYQFDDILTDSKSSTFKNPKTISSLSIGNQRKISKNSSHLSTSTRSINQLNESNLSLNIRSSRYMPPNPYSVITKPIPVSCQDSEIQSVVSQDDRYSKLDKNIKKNLIANKNAKLNMPEFQPNPDEPTVPLKTHTNAKKSQVPLSESDPKKFFELVACKLEAVLNGGEYRTRKRSLSNSNLNEEDIDDQLDEHLDRVYNNHHHHKVQSPKMCIKKSDQLSHKFNNLSINHAKQKSHHHFYQLTSTSKEVDIDSQHNNLISSVDSGVSTRSVASIERVNDWLTNSKNNEGSNVEKCKKIEEENLNVKTTVAYYLPGEDLAYISTFNGKYLTLAQFKQLITKKGSFRYFFKTKSDLLDEECVVYQEATDDMAYVPMFNNKVIAKIEKLNGGAH
ncbi:unnamed protein product [Brachionus calyciflorus]|uniref:Axin n=1 Tax=Brachionus calyciflorus TaxID=104777 RepID=A0A813P566_9BILA|nr:unnamed protein product [Brachionus calyciflorus]